MVAARKERQTNMISIVRYAVLLVGLGLCACGAETGQAMSGTDPGANAPNIQQRAATMTAAQTGTSTGVTSISAGTSEGRSARPQAVRSSSQAVGNLEAPPSDRPVNPYQGGRGSN